MIWSPFKLSDAASGGAFDWAYDGAGIKQSYTRKKWFGCNEIDLIWL